MKTNISRFQRIGAASEAALFFCFLPINVKSHESRFAGNSYHVLENQKAINSIRRTLMPNDFKTPEEQGHAARNDQSEKVDATTKASKEQEALFGRVSRRSFLTNLMAASGAAGVAATATPLLAATPAAEPAQDQAQTPKVPGAIPVTLNVNGKEH